MGKTYWLRVALMITSLGAVIWVMQNLHGNGLNQRIAATLGSMPQSLHATHPRVDLCETRVLRVKSGGVEVYESGMNWFMKRNAIEKRLDPVAVEKWFGRNCSVIADELRQVASKDTTDAKTVLSLDFNQGGSAAIKKNDSGQFIWKNIAFRSQQLEEALHQLPELREPGAGGRRVRPAPQMPEDIEKVPPPQPATEEPATQED